MAWQSYLCRLETRVRPFPLPRKVDRVPRGRRKEPFPISADHTNDMWNRHRSSFPPSSSHQYHDRRRSPHENDNSSYRSSSRRSPSPRRSSSSSSRSRYSSSNSPQKGANHYTRNIRSSSDSSPVPPKMLPPASTSSLTASPQELVPTPISPTKTDFGEEAFKRISNQMTEVEICRQYLEKYQRKVGTACFMIYLVTIHPSCMKQPKNSLRRLKNWMKCCWITKKM